jgi:hypothetical protein
MVPGFQLRALQTKGLLRQLTIRDMAPEVPLISRFSFHSRTGGADAS